MLEFLSRRIPIQFQYSAGLLGLMSYLKRLCLREYIIADPK
jgi:hypothetical protein